MSSAAGAATTSGVSAASIRRLLAPRSLAVVGASSDPAAIGGAPLVLLERFGYAGEIHLVSRSRTEIGGRPCVASLDDLPEGVDAAIFAIPQAGVHDALAAAARRGIGGVIAFSSGYGEVGEDGLRAQLALAELARAHDVALAGPNCLGLVNFVDGVPLTFGDVAPNRRASETGLAIVAQSGAMSLALTYAAMAQDIPVSFAISTGNEAVLSIEDYLAVLLEEDHTKVVALLIEQIRHPDRFLELARRARERDVALCVLHTGRSSRAQVASLTHTGAIAGDQDVLRAVVAREGVLFIDSLDELIDTAGLLTKTSRPTRAGVGFMTDSGAAKTFALDCADQLGLELPELDVDSRARMTDELPPFATPSNPTDITAMGLNDPSLYARVATVLLDDEAVGTLVVSAMPGSALQGREQIEALVPTLAAATKPVVYTIMGGECPLPEENRLRILDAGLSLFRSPERALRAVAHTTHLSQLLDAATRERSREPDVVLEGVTTSLGEVGAKEVLARAGIPVPRSLVVSIPAEAGRAAEELGGAVVLKIVSRDIAHKSDVGGVAIVDRGSDVEARATRMLDEVARRAPNATIEGFLVEEALASGVEMIVGARRDPNWGPVVLVGVGGVWAEFADDHVLVAGDAGREEVRAALESLRSAALLRGARGDEPRDVEALIDFIGLVNAIMRANAHLSALELNPVLVRREGEGVVALDALIEVGR